jgi:hypothetical protein
VNAQSREAEKKIANSLKIKPTYLASAARALANTNEDLRIAEANAQSRKAAANFEAFLYPPLSLEEAGTGLHVKGGKRRRRTQRKQQKRRKSRKSY